MKDKMDSKTKDLTSPREDTWASLEELYTDFDQWVRKLQKFVSKRCNEPHRETSQSNIKEELFGIHEMLIHGIFLRKTPVENYDAILRDIDSFVNNDYVILAVMRNSKYMKSKL